VNLPNKNSSRSKMVYVCKYLKLMGSLLMSDYMQEVLYLLGPERTRLLKLLVIFLGVSLLDLIGIGLVASYITLATSPQNTPEFINAMSTWAGFSDDGRSILTMMSVVLLLVFLFKTVTGILVSRAIINFAIGQQIRLRCYLMNAYQSLPYEKYIERNSSEYIYAMQALVAQYSNKVVITALNALSSGVVAALILCMLAWTNIIIFMVIISLVGVLVVGYDSVFRVKIKQYGGSANTAATKLVQDLTEGVKGLKEIRISQNEDFFYKRVKLSVERYGKYYALSSVIGAIPRYLIEFVMVIFIISTVVITSYFTTGSEPNLLSTLSLFGVALIRLIPTINVISTAMVQWRFNRDGVSRLYKDICFLESEDSKVDGVKLASNNSPSPSPDRPFHSIKLSNIVYRYPGSKHYAINEINIEVRCGESIGLVGESGSGKSTLLDVFLGLLVPVKGTIDYNEKPLDDHLMNEWRSHVAYLPQEVFLTDDSLKRNIALGLEGKDICEKRILEVLKQVKLDSLLEQLPDGIEASIGEGGVKLSGGQKQRISLARAFYHKKDVLVMDESTSSLDDKTEKQIVKEIKLLKGSRTMIIVAHRFSTVQHCDRIYRLEKGKIISMGTPAEIL
jgi:ATP-binding cassette, subfamily B, bacterial PglK